MHGLATTLTRAELKWTMRITARPHERRQAVAAVSLAYRRRHASAHTPAMPQASAAAAPQYPS